MDFVPTIALLALLVANTSCSGDRSCRTVDPSIVVPASRVADVSRVRGAGPACDDSSIECSDPPVGDGGNDAGASAACRDYVIHPRAVGACRVTFEYSSGATPVTFDVAFVEAGATGYPEPCRGGLVLTGTVPHLAVPELDDAGSE